MSFVPTYKTPLKFSPTPDNIETCCFGSNNTSRCRTIARSIDLNIGQNQGNETMKCILVLAANPQSTDRLELEREAAIIRAQTGRYRKYFEVQTEIGVRIEDLRGYLSKHQPTIVHVVGERNATGEIRLADESCRVVAVTPAEITKLFATEQPQIECVILNNCFSEEIANALMEFIPCTIGIYENNHDRGEDTFISEFYQGIFTGKGYYGAYELGCKQIPAEREEKKRPCLRTKDRTLLGIPEYVRSPNGRSRSPQSNQTEAPLVYPLWYGTNRKPEDATGEFKGFSGQGKDLTHYGICEVVVKKAHKFGSTESFRQLFTGDGNRRDPIRIRQMVEKDFWPSVKSNLAEIDPGKWDALVFIHGYNVSFADAAKTAAQLGCDLGILMTAFYSWPSKGSLEGYWADGDSIQDSEDHIANFLSEFVKVAQADRVHIIAHSMGNRGLLRSIEKIAKQFTGQAKPFGQIILAAPDVSPILFKNEATAYQKIADRTTLYVSRKDKALLASSRMHKNSRAGFSPPVTIVPTIDTIDVSDTDPSLLGHGYCMDNRDVLRDMHSLLNKNQPPDDRGLESGVSETQKYWTIKPSPSV
jgi:esterase/lipase superfamily enzyme